MKTKFMIGGAAVLVAAIAIGVAGRMGKKTPQEMGAIPGEIVVGFRKNVSQADAEALLTKNSLTFQRTKQVNMGKIFFYEAGETFIVKVPEGQEKKWIEALAKEPSVYETGAHMDPNKIMVD